MYEVYLINASIFQLFLSFFQRIMIYIIPKTTQINFQSTFFYSSFSYKNFAMFGTFDNFTAAKRKRKKLKTTIKL